MKVALVLTIALAGIAVARVARVGAVAERPHDLADVPYAPSPAAAPIVTLGYREIAADLLFVRMVGYFGSPDNEAAGIAALAEATVALDPAFRRVYDFGAVAMTAAKRGVDNSIHLRAIALLEQAAREFPTHWRFPNLAGQIYLVDLQTEDPAQRRAWDEKGALLLETAARKPNAPAEAAMHAAILQSRFGKQQRAINGLRELLLITDDDGARRRIIEKLAELADEDADEIAAELLTARTQFERAWRKERPAVPPSLYILLGPPAEPGFDLTDLATGGRDVIGADGFERLEPLDDEPAADAPPSPPPG